MTTPADAERMLFEGDSLNVVGLPGSGQSRLLRDLHAHLSAGGWDSELMTGQEIVNLPSKRFRMALADLSAKPMPVLLIDDYGRVLMDEAADRIERNLFAAVERLPTNANEYLRVVIASSPRDREIVSPLSTLRDRMRVIDCLDVEAHEACAAAGLDQQAWITLAGGNPHFLPETPSGAPQPSAVAGISRALASWYVGKLRADGMERLARILRDSPPSRWRPETDPTLLPLVVRDESDGNAVAVPPSALDRSAYEDLLYTKRWPERDLHRSAARFRARCGDEPSPIWVDSFLSDTSTLDFRLVVQFLEAVFGEHGAPQSVRLLSRATVAGSTVSPGDIAAAMYAAGAPTSTLARIEWRQYRRATVGNLHDRRLVLPRRGVAIGLPPADIILGLRDVGNETDSELRTAEHSATLTAWRTGTPVTW